jgi:hypothetical protein
MNSVMGHDDDEAVTTCNAEKDGGAHFVAPLFRGTRRSGFAVTMTHDP